MSIIEHRLSTALAQADFLPPDERSRASLIEDYEKGPVALNDTSEGIDYQVWALAWQAGSGDFIVTPETVGTPVTVLNAANVSQCSLCFDQNGHINIAYVASGQAYLYWYDTVLGTWTTDALDASVISVMLTMDDKRPTQTSANDMILWYTRDMGGSQYDLFTREQRDRFDTEYPMKANVNPYIIKCGMHEGLRLQVGLRAFP